MNKEGVERVLGVGKEKTHINSSSSMDAETLQRCTRLLFFIAKVSLQPFSLVPTLNCCFNPTTVITQRTIMNNL